MTKCIYFIRTACHRVLVFEITRTIYLKDLQIQRFQTRLWLLKSTHIRFRISDVFSNLNEKKIVAFFYIKMCNCNNVTNIVSMFKYAFTVFSLITDVNNYRSDKTIAKLFQFKNILLCITDIAHIHVFQWK